MAPNRALCGRITQLIPAENWMASYKRPDPVTHQRLLLPLVAFALMPNINALGSCQVVGLVAAPGDLCNIMPADEVAGFEGYVADWSQLEHEMDGAWAADDMRRAFVAGAMWRQYQQTGFTPWPDERNIAEQEAERRYPGGRLEAVGT